MEKSGAFFLFELIVCCFRTSSFEKARGFAGFFVSNSEQIPVPNFFGRRESNLVFAEIVSSRRFFVLGDSRIREIPYRRTVLPRLRSFQARRVLSDRRPSMKANVKSLFLHCSLAGMALLFCTGCYTGPYRYYDQCQMGSTYSRPCDRYLNDYGYGGGYGYRPYQNYYYRQYPYYNNAGGGGGHNPFHVPSGRYHNIGRPSKWKL